jgi:hypothetical protein
MPIKRPASAVVYAALACSLFAASDAPTIAQVSTADLSGRWALNRELSENAEAKLQHSEPQAGGHRPPAGMHGLGALFGGGGKGDADRARDMFLRRPTSLVVTQDGARIQLTDSDGRVRVLNAGGQKQTVDGRDVRTKWDNGRLVSETSVGSAKLTDTYERIATPPQLVVTTKMEMSGSTVSVRRVYDAESR